MRSARPGRLRLGDRVRFQEHTYTVVGLTGMRVRLADGHGTGMLVEQVHLQAAEDFAVLGSGERAALGSAALLGHLPKEVADRALWWQRHLVELSTGLPPDAPASTCPRPEYDPATRSLSERERAKAAELAALVEEISARTVKRKRQRYEAGGVEAVVDHRLAPHASLLGQADRAWWRRSARPSPRAWRRPPARSSTRAGEPGRSWPPSTARTRWRCRRGPRSTASSATCPAASM